MSIYVNYQNYKTFSLSHSADRAEGQFEKQSRIPSPGEQQEGKLSKVYQDVTTSRPWRHTIGRISCLVRIPLYLVGMAFQTAKIGIKGVIAPIATLAAWGLKTDKLHSWTFTGVAKDGLAWVRLLDKIGSSTLGVIFAPPKQYHSLYGAFSGLAKIVLGGYQKKEGDGGLSVKRMAKQLVNMRPQYSKLIIQSESIYGGAVTQKGRNSVKAG